MRAPAQHESHEDDEEDQDDDDAEEEEEEEGESGDRGPQCPKCKAFPGASQFEAGKKTCETCRRKCNPQFRLEMEESEDTDDTDASDSDEGPYCTTCKKRPGADMFDPDFKTCTPCRNKFRQRSAGSQASAAPAVALFMASQKSDKDHPDTDESEADLRLGPYCSTRNHYPGADQFRDGLKTCNPCLERRRKAKSKAQGHMSPSMSPDPKSHVPSSAKAIVVSPPQVCVWFGGFLLQIDSRALFFAVAFNGDVRLIPVLVLRVAQRSSKRKQCDSGELVALPMPLPKSDMHKRSKHNASASSSGTCFGLCV
jgi:hypothetical protein